MIAGRHRRRTYTDRWFTTSTELSLYDAMKSQTSDPKIESLLSGYGSLVPITVQWGDMDSFRHVNNVVYARWTETARICALTDLVTAEGKDNISDEERRRRQQQLRSLMSATSIGVIIKSLFIKYKRPITYPDIVIAGTAITNISDDRFTMSTLLISSQHQCVAALGDSEMVCYDYRNAKKSPWPSHIVDSLREYQKQFPGETKNKSSNFSHS